MTDSAVRLDKWLWAARFYKTRSLAKDAIEGGKVHYNGARCKPSRTVEVGAQVRLRTGFDERTVLIEAISDKRRGAPEAQQLYRETEESIERRTLHAEQRKAQRAAMAAPDHRPNKKERRDIMKLKDTLNS
jgi:ribosome-associated heat shock protein Hsp15